MNTRRVATVILVVVTCLLTLVSAIALWLRALVLNTDSYVRAIGPVLDQPAVRESLAENIVAGLYDNVDVAARLRAALPESAAEFAPTLAASIRTTSVQVASAALATSAVRQAWKQANRVAHDQIVQVLEDKGGVVRTTNGEVSIDTGALASSVRRALDANGITVFDSVPSSALAGTFVLFRSTELMHAQRLTRVLDEVATWLPFVTVVVGAGAIVSSTRRRRAVEVIAVGIAVVMVVIAIGIAIGRGYYLARVGAQYRTIAAAPFDALIGPLRAGTQFAFVVALLVAAAARLTGSTTLRVREQRAWTQTLELGRRNATRLAGGGAGLAAVVLVAWDTPRPFVVFTTLAVLALWELGCFLLSRPGPHTGSVGGGDPNPAAN